MASEFVEHSLAQTLASDQPRCAIYLVSFTNLPPSNATADFD